MTNRDERLEQARLLYERAQFHGDADALVGADRALDGVEADLALARGRIIHTRYLNRRNADPDHAKEDPQELALFERAVRLYRSLDDSRGEAEALFWVGCFHQVVRGDQDTSRPAFERSNELAAQAGDKLTQSYALRHLGFGDHLAGRLDAARAHFEESTRLRREVGFLPGVAANLIGLAYVAAGQDRHDDALAILAEAEQLAESLGAQSVLDHVTEARAALTSA